MLGIDAQGGSTLVSGVATVYTTSKELVVQGGNEARWRSHLGSNFEMKQGLLMALLRLDLARDHQQWWDSARFQGEVKRSCGGWLRGDMALGLL